MKAIATALVKAIATALRHAVRLNGRCCYTNGGLVVLVLGARLDGNGNAVGRVFTHECPSAGAAEQVALRIWTTWQTFPHLPPQSALEVTAEYVAAERRVALRRMGRRWWS